MALILLHLGVGELGNDHLSRISAGAVKNICPKARNDSAHRASTMNLNVSLIRWE